MASGIGATSLGLRHAENAARYAQMPIISGQVSRRAHISPAELMALQNRSRTSRQANEIFQSLLARSAEDLDEQEQGAGEEGTGDGEGQAASPEDLQDAEQAGAKDSFRYSGDQNKNNQGQQDTSRKGKKRRKALFLVGGVAGGLIGIMVAVIIFLLPHHLQSLVNLANARAFASPQGAMREMGKVYQSYYIKNVVAASISNRCPTTRRTSACAFAFHNPTNPVWVMWDKWHQGNIENKWAAKGLIIGRDSAGKIYMTIPGKTSQTDISAVLSGEKTIFDMPGMTEHDAQIAMRDTLRQTTFWHRTYLRWQLRPVMAKYGIRRCITFCASGVNTLVGRGREFIRDRTVKAKLYLISRVIAPHSASMGLALQCIVTSGCDPTKKADNGGINGAERNQYEIENDAALERFAAKYGTESLDELLNQANDVLKKGYARYLAEQLVSFMVGKLGGDQAAKEASKQITSKAVPIIGWAVLAAQVIDFVSHANPKQKALQFMLTVQAGVAMYALYQSAADETRSGNMDTETLQGLSLLLSDEVADTNGNHSNAEDTPYYQRVINGDFPTSLETSLSNKAYAAESFSSTTRMRCNDNKPPPVDPGVCKEEDPDATSAFGEVLGDVSQAIPAPVAQLASMVSGGVDKLSGWVFGPITEVAQHIPGVQQIASNIGDWVSYATGPLMEFFQSKILLSPLAVFMSGGRTGTLVFMGAVQSASEFSQHMLGGRVLSLDELYSVTQSELSEQKDEFASLPLKDRLFSTDTPYSLASRAALSINPRVGSSLRDNFAGMLANPFGKLASGVTGMFSSRQTFAGNRQQLYPGIEMSGYMPEDLKGLGDPADYWDKNCADGTKTTAWNNSVVPNPNTFTPENHTVNLCLLIQSSTGAYGAMYGVPQPD